jgi:hypothetical protein
MTIQRSKNGSSEKISEKIDSADSRFIELVVSDLSANFSAPDALPACPAPLTLVPTLYSLAARGMHTFHTACSNLGSLSSLLDTPKRDSFTALDLRHWVTAASPFDEGRIPQMHDAIVDWSIPPALMTAASTSCPASCFNKFPSFAAPSS